MWIEPQQGEPCFYCGEPCTVKLLPHRNGKPVYSCGEHINWAISDHNYLAVGIFKETP